MLAKVLSPSKLLGRLRTGLAAFRFESWELPWKSAKTRQQAESALDSLAPRIAFVKQETQDDLYCCPPNSDARTIVLSTLMRSGPVALFSRLHADFVLVKCEADEECQIWKEKAVDLGWYELRSLEALREHVPNRTHGQGDFAVAADAVDWGAYDIVISLDVSVPARITRAYPTTLWCYYVREPKTRSYSSSLEMPAPGQHMFLNQCYSARAHSAKPHVLNFPYYLQYFGVFRELLGTGQERETPNKGIFLEHHTPVQIEPVQLEQLESFGPVDSTSRISSGSHKFVADPMRKCMRQASEILNGLTQSKYFVALAGKRRLWGNAAVEAIAAGALVIGDPQAHFHSDCFSPHTSVRTSEELLRTVRFLETHPSIYTQEVQRQRRIIDYLCYWRPLRDLLSGLANHRRKS